MNYFAVTIVRINTENGQFENTESHKVMNNAELEKECIYLSVPFEDYEHVFSMVKWSSITIVHSIWPKSWFIYVTKIA